MNGKIDKVRKALETLCEALELALARLGVCGQGDGADHKADADSIGGTNALTMGRAALSTLSAIDPEAIRAEARAEALKDVAVAIAGMNQMAPSALNDDYLIGYGFGIRDCQIKIESIIADEPKKRDDREDLLYKSDVDDRG